MRWNEFLDTANRLVRGRTEGDWRSAVSRAYYAVFHYFRGFLLAHGVNLGRAGNESFQSLRGVAELRGRHGRPGSPSESTTCATNGLGPITTSAGTSPRPGPSR